MPKCFLIILLSLCSFVALAQGADSLIAVRKGNAWAIKYAMKPGETLSMIAHRFKLPADSLEHANELDIRKKLTVGYIIYIPVTTDNYFVSKQPLDLTNLRELYYHIAPKDEIGVISTYAGITKAEMRTWNNLHGNTLTVGQVLFIGWVKMITNDSTNPTNGLSYPVYHRPGAVDTSRKAAGGLDTLYNTQTDNGLNVLTEKGTAVFFEKTGKSNIFYAFHNTTKRGTVIKVFNPGTGKTVFVKVLGPIPDTKLYANSIIGICAAAKEVLGITDNKAWCELTYSAN